MVSNGRDNNAMVSVADCSIYNNRSYGIFVTGSTNAELKNNACVDNKRNGITFIEDADGRLSGNLCKSNAHHGISIGDNAVVKASANTCADNKWSGIYFASKGQFDASNNNCSGNGCNGIDVDSRIIVYAAGNTCRRNGVNGIYLRNGVSGTVYGNTCAENKLHGISIEKGSRPTAEGNICFANKGCGIYDEGVKLGQNKLYDNNEFCQNEVQMYLTAEDFGELERMASRIRDEKRRFANGTWQLEYFYGSFEIGYGSQPFEDNVKLCKTWFSRYPSSITPRIALATSLCQQGWHIRGGGYADTVSPTAWEPFEQYLSKALDVLKEAEKLDVKDPSLYTTWIYVATGLENISDIEMAFIKGVEIEPTYLPLYANRGFAYLPRWYGKPGKYERLAAEAADKTKNEIGQSLYFLLARRLTRWVKTVDEFREAGFDYERIKQGQKDYAKQFPDSLDLETINRMCFMACASGDRESARAYFTDIGGNWHEKVWRDVQTFEKYKTWAGNRNQ
jgi:parallel beta-helix repeat protein